MAAQAIGAATRLLDEAWWGPTMHIAGEDRARMLFTERSMPGAIVVNKRGARFFNESVAYTTAVQAMYADGNLPAYRSEEHTSELQSLMRISYAVFCLKKKKKKHNNSRSTK